MLYMNKRKTDPDPDPVVMENCTMLCTEMQPLTAAHWWGMEAQSVFGGSNKPTQGGLTLETVTMVPSWFTLRVEINMFRFALQTLIRMPSTRVCRS